MITVDKNKTEIKGKYDDVSTEIIFAIVNYLCLSHSATNKLEVSRCMLDICNLIGGYKNAMLENKTPEECVQCALEHMVKEGEKNGI